MSSAEPTPKTARSFRILRIALPNEHGGWGFLFEPLVAGLAIAFSPAAIWISLMVTGAFLTRQPLRVLIADQMGTQIQGRARTALGFVVLFGVIFVVGLTAALATAGWAPMMPFLLVAPFVILQIYFDVSRRSRRLIPELTGAVSISASAAAIALAGGMGWPNALGLWAIFISRLVPSIIYVRERLRLEKGKSSSILVPAIAHGGGLLVVAVLAYNGYSPYLPVFVMMLLFYRAVAGLSTRRKKMRAMQIGIREVIYGLITVLSVIVGHYTGF